MNRRNLIAGIAALPLLALPGGGQASAAEQSERAWVIRTDNKGYPKLVDINVPVLSIQDLRNIEHERFRLWSDALNAEYYAHDPIPFYE